MAKEDGPRFHHEEVCCSRRHLKGRPGADPDHRTVFVIKRPIREHRHEVDDAVSESEEEVLHHPMVVVTQTHFLVDTESLDTEVVTVHLIDGSASVLVGHHPSAVELGEEFFIVLLHGASFRAGDLRTRLTLALFVILSMLGIKRG